MPYFKKKINSLSLPYSNWDFSTIAADFSPDPAVISLLSYNLRNNTYN